MDPTQVASTTSALVSLGFSPHVAGIASLVLAGLGILWTGAMAMSKLPVADRTSSAAYQIFFGLLARATGNFGNNAPVPPSGMVAGGIVPTPAVAPAATIGADPTHPLAKFLNNSAAVNADNKAWPTTVSGGATTPVPIPRPPGAD